MFQTGTSEVFIKKYQVFTEEGNNAAHNKWNKHTGSASDLSDAL